MGITIKKIFYFCFLTMFCCYNSPFLLAQSSLLSVASTLSPSINNDSLENLVLQSIDGPYLFKNKKNHKLITVVKSDNDFQIHEEIISKKQITLQCVVDNKDKDFFSVPIMKKIKIPRATYKQPEKLMAISDIEGNFNAFYSLLLSLSLIHISEPTRPY